MTNPHRLPRTAIPSRYLLEISPDLDASTFSGTVQIEVELLEPLGEITLNALDLEIDSAAVSSAGPARVEFDPDLQRVRLITSQVIPAGPAIVTAQFRGELNNKLVGFYRTSLTDDEGVVRELASTQFEATDARRAFPCFDEPDLKATFQVSLVVPEHLAAFSNTREISRTNLGDGLVRVEFAETMRMSTYLVAYAVGPFEASDPVVVDGVPIRIITPLGQRHLIHFALESAGMITRSLADYYDIPYPGDKLDHIAVPDFAFGAMENLGLIVYRESSLLLNRATATQAEMQKVFDVIAHEIAHMWFGDLVTMKWWNGIWLNEAFATFMEMRTTDSLHPEWKRWLSFGADERAWAYGIDGLDSSRPIEFEVISPEDANEMFDALTYGKGSSVLRMLEQFIGEDSFRAGVGAYLKRHAYQNTVTADLWKSLDEHSPIPVGEVMNTWIHLEGYPKVAVGVDGSRVRLAQKRFQARPGRDSEAIWKIPIQVRGATNGKPFRRSLLLDQRETWIELDGRPDWILANADGYGYYRVRYQPAEYHRLKGVLPKLEALERFTLIDDAFAFAENGESAIGDFLDLAEGYADEPEPAVWDSIKAAIDSIALHVADDDDLPEFRRWVVELARTGQEGLGWESAPEDSELDRRLRGIFIQLMGKVGADPATLEKSRDLTSMWLKDPASTDPEVGFSAAFTVAAHGDIHIHSELLTTFEATTDPQMKDRLLQALALIDTIEATEATLAAIGRGSVRVQDIAWVTGNLLMLRGSGPFAWASIAENWESVYSAMPPLTVRKFYEGLPGLSRVADQVESFFAQPRAPNTRTLRQQLERLRVNVEFRRLQSGLLRQRFGASGSDSG